MFPSHRGFTLVEILIAMSMIGILASVMFPSLTPYIARGRDSSRVADIKTIQTYLKTYEIDTGKYIDHTSGCVPYTTLQNAGYSTTLPKSPGGELYDEGCGPNGQYAYGTSTGLLIGHGVSLLMSHMERESGGNYSGSTNGMTGDITPIGYLLMNATEKGSGPWYLMIDSGDTGSGSSGSGAPPPNIDGGWSAWGPVIYGPCSTSCGPGTQTGQQFRSCINPAPSGTGANCTGPGIQAAGSQACNMGVCNTDGVCDNSTQFACSSGTSTSNATNYTGASCGGTSTWGCNGSGTGTSTNATACSKVNPVCVINCVGSWGSCSGGSQTYTITTAAANGGTACVATNGATQSCGTPAVCDNNTQFACTSGTSVSNVAGSCGGSSTWGCNSTDGGANTAPTACTKSNAACAVNCVGSWADNATPYCSATCGGGNLQQTFTITTPASGGGLACETYNGNTRWGPSSCNTSACSTPATVTAWSACSFGNQSRTCTEQTGGHATTCASLGATPGVNNQACGTPASCNNSVQFSCASGTSASNVTNYTGASCGGTSTWGCNSADGGTNTTSTACSKINPSCIAAPVVSATTLFGGMISWSWASIPSATSYEWSIDNGYTSSTQAGTTVNISLSCNAMHDLKARACIGASCSDWSNISNQLSPPCPVSSITPGGTTTTSVSSTWTSSPGSNYYRYWNNTINKVVFINSTSYTDTSLTCGTGYNIYIQGCTTNSDYSCGGFTGPITLTTQDCPTSGAYTYGSWGSCSVSCGGGTQTRTQTCDYDSCYSPQATSQSCNTQACPLTWNYNQSLQTNYCNGAGYGGPTLNNPPSGTCSTKFSTANDFTVHYSIGQCPEPGKETWEYYHMEWDEYHCL